jgi:hypothetical protein
MTKHTPGPWYYKDGSMGQGLIISEQTGANIAVAYDKRDSALLAASPELLEALLDMWNLINVDVSTDTIKAGTTFKTARAAIAKATGK